MSKREDAARVVAEEMWPYAKAVNGELKKVKCPCCRKLGPFTYNIDRGYGQCFHEGCELNGGFSLGDLLRVVGSAAPRAQALFADSARKWEHPEYVVDHGATKAVDPPSLMLYPLVWDGELVWMEYRLQLPVGRDGKATKETRSVRLDPATDAWWADALRRGEAVVVKGREIADVKRALVWNLGTLTDEQRQILYPGHVMRGNWKDGDAVVIVEGCRVAEEVRTLGLKNWHAVTKVGGAKNWSEFAVKQIPQTASRIAILADDDEAGEASAWQVAELLYETHEKVSRIGIMPPSAYGMPFPKADIRDWIVRERSVRGEDGIGERFLKLLSRCRDVRQILREGKRGTGKGDQRPLVTQDSAGLSVVLARLGIEARHDERMGRDEWRGSEVAGCGEWHPGLREGSRVVADVSRRGFRVARETKKSVRYVDADWPAAKIEDRLSAMAAANRVDVLRDWILGLDPWDGTGRLDMAVRELWAVDMEGEGVELLPWIGQFLFVGLVQRTLEPGCLLEEVPLILGPQGTGKSTSMRALLAPELRFLFSDTVDLGGTRKELAESLQGRAVIELADIILTGPDWLQARMRRHISAPSDWVRQAYRADPSSLLRRCIMVGTSDEYLVIGDDRGGRRFVPFRIHGRGGGEHYLNAHRDQLFAEALARYRAGVRAGLPGELEKAAREAVERHWASDDAFAEGVIFAFLETLGGRTEFTLAEAMAACAGVEGYAVNQRSDAAVQKSCARVLRYSGWRSCRKAVAVEGTQARKWITVWRRGG